MVCARYISLPMRHGRIPLVDAVDVAQVAATVLLRVRNSDKHEKGTETCDVDCNLTGSGCCGHCTIVTCELPLNVVRYLTLTFHPVLLLCCVLHFLCVRGVIMARNGSHFIGGYRVIS